MMFEVYDKNLNKVAYLENAFEKIEDTKINAINYLNFNLPNDDPKIEFLKPFHYVKCGKNLYRILPKVVQTEETDILSVECEHVLATLLNDVIFGNVIIGNLGTYTREVIEFVLSKQKVKNWKLGRCDFSRQFEYCWENENLASALFSIPKPLAEDYMWTFDTENYPWTINLIKLDKNKDPDVYIQKKKNLIRLSNSSDPKQLFTRIYPLGYGEGVNQLTIKDINNGVPYLQSPKYITDKYGIIETIWIDRRYENVESLRDAAQAMLKEFQEPLKEYELTYQAIDEREKINLGSKIRIMTDDGYYDDFVVGIKYIYDNITDTSITIANKTRTIATTIADLADRQRIEMAYSQGATQLYAQSLQVNAAPNDGAELNFFIPQEMRVVNKVVAKIKMESFRAYSKATKGGGASSDTTSGGGGYYGTTEDGGGSYPSTSWEGEKFTTTTPYYLGGESIQSENDSYNWGTHNHGIPRGATWWDFDSGGNRKYIGQWMPSGAHNHGSHDHDVQISGHNHSVTVSSHRHNLDIKPHTHSFSIPDHEHEIVPGIFKFGNPRYFDVKVNGKMKGRFSTDSWECDLTDYLLDNKKRISRGSWQSVEIIPSDLAYISIDLMLQGFVQSRGDYTV